MASSLNSVAMFFEACSSHISKLRAAVAMELLNTQLDVLNGIPACDIATLEIAFDESEQITTFDGINGLYDMLMMHCRLYITDRDTGRTHKYEIACPPAFLKGKTAAHILRGLLSRIPFSLSGLAAKIKWLNICIVTDSAKSCKKVGRHFAAKAVVGARAGGSDEVADGEFGFKGMTTLQSFCLMHQLALIFGMVLKTFSILCPMFCSCCLMQKGMHRRQIRDHVKRLCLGTKIIF